MKFADLHLHTTYSDGTFSPQELFKAAQAQGIACVGIVDHDTVEGLAPSQELSGGFGIELIPGIELTTQYDGQEIHVLGYCIDYRNALLIEKLDSLRNSRVRRIYQIVEKLKGQGVDLDPQKICAMAPLGTVGRMHIARTMVAEGIVHSVPEAFARYIGDRCPAYVLGFELSPMDAIALIRSTGGIAVLAHPYLIRSDDTLYSLLDAGIMGLEVYYPEHSQAMINFYLGIARERALVVTGGSDCHGSAKPDLKVGAARIPYDLVETLKERKTRIR